MLMQLLLSLMPKATVVTGQVVLTGSGNWTVPAGVFSISLVGVGCGARQSFVSKVGNVPGGGGELRYLNNMAVTPGDSIPYSVGQVNGGGGNSGGPTTFNTTSLVAKGGKDGAFGSVGGSGGTGTGGGNGGDGNGGAGGGGGGAGGYSGKGGNANASAPAGGGGGGGANSGNRGGGGVGLLGEGTSGGVNTGGSGGANSSSGDGGAYGGGSGSASTVPGLGGLRIIWPGTTRQFPSTNTADM